jgi:hypothetical protein
MFNTFTFKSLASLVLIVAIAGIGAAEPALAKKKKMEVPGHWERSEDGGFEWVGKKSKKLKGAEPVVRDHRNGADGGGVVVSNTPQDPIVRDHRTEPVVRDHRDEPIVRDHRKKKIFGMPAAN